MSDKFFYFGFGSNMLAKRLHIQNPRATRIGRGKLIDYRLDFHTHSCKWRGAPATIVPSVGDRVYGAIWEIDSSHLKDLDNQEGVDKGIYRSTTVVVLCNTTESYIECRTYHLTEQPETDLKDMPHHLIPDNRKPSATYLKTLVKGATETGIPTDYINFLRNIANNGIVIDELEDSLELQDITLCES